MNEANPYLALVGSSWGELGEAQLGLQWLKHACLVCTWARASTDTIAPGTSSHRLPRKATLPLPISPRKLPTYIHNHHQHQHQHQQSSSETTRSTLLRSPPLSITLASSSPFSTPPPSIMAGRFVRASKYRRRKLSTPAQPAH